MKKTNKSNFITLMACLDAPEIVDFGLHLKHSHARHEMTKKIYPFYKKYHEAKKRLPKVEIAYQELYKKTPTQKDITRFNNKLSKFFQELKDFLIFRKIKENEFEKDFLWLKILQHKGLIHEKKLYFNRVLQQENIKGNTDLAQSFRLFQLHDFAIADPDFDKDYGGFKKLLLSLQYLEVFRLNVNLKYANELKNREKFLQVKSTDFYFEQVLKFYQENQNLATIPTKLYIKLYDFQENENWDTYKIIKLFFWQHKDDFETEEQQIIIYLINYIARQIKTGKSELNQDAFELYQFALEKGVLLNNGIMNPRPFQSIINVACFLDEIEWAEQFIDDYQHYLEADIREESVNLALANLYFKQEEFNKVYDLLKDIELRGSLLQILIKAHFLASAYEIKANIDIEEKCNNLSKYVRRHSEIGAANQEAVKEFCAILKILYRRRSTKKNLNKKVKSAKHLYFRQWIEHKIKDYQPII